MKSRSKVIIGVVVAGFLTALQAEHVVIVADSRGVSVEAEVSYEDGHRFSDDDIAPVFRVFEHGSESVFVDVPTEVDPLDSTPDRKKIRGCVADRLENVGQVEVVSFSAKR